MWRLLYILFCYVFIMVLGTGDMGPGIWNIIAIKKCAEDASFNTHIEVTKTKVNRSCDAYGVIFDFEFSVDEHMGLRIDVGKEVDGGCKPVQVFADDSFWRFCIKYAEGNCLNVLKLAGIELGDSFFIEKGKYSVKDFVCNVCELPEECPYGKYVATVYLIKDSREVACLEVTVECILDTECVCADPSECEDEDGK